MATVRNFLNELSGQPEQQKKAEGEAAHLVKYAESKLENMETKIRNKFLNRQLEDQIEIVGDKLGSFTKGYRVNVDSGAVGDAIKGIVEKVMLIGDAGASDIIGGVISNSLDAMFSSVGVEEREEQLFAVVFAGMALVRYDFYVWKFESRSEGLFTEVRSVIAYTYATSVIDHELVSSARLLQSIYNFMGSNATPEAVADYVERMQKAYDAIAGSSSESAATEHITALNDFSPRSALLSAEAVPPSLFE